MPNCKMIMISVPYRKYKNGPLNYDTCSVPYFMVRPHLQKKKMVAYLKTNSLMGKYLFEVDQQGITVLPDIRGADSICWLNSTDVRHRMEIVNKTVDFYRSEI